MQVKNKPCMECTVIIRFISWNQLEPRLKYKKHFERTRNRKRTKEVKYGNKKERDNYSHSRMTWREQKGPSVRRYRKPNAGKKDCTLLQ